MSAELSWFKSSYSDDQGGDCLEVAYIWRKSSHSDSQGGACLEVALCPHTIHLRDSKLGARSPRFDVPADAWAVFVAYVSREA
ncbi:DUF397 domain-containing protein [Streptomyces sp. NL15-2K]|uniref:DUF397 domain-containing protein n=1 Tax=Streptomyces sp. NL15-2K TaxID=376149 RepID=UPI000F568943|nr:DUF397 domain-containing protein [Streptomyces sp. NL15-2K]